jgi:hypothetical protein
MIEKKSHDNRGTKGQSFDIFLTDEKAPGCPSITQFSTTLYHMLEALLHKGKEA